MNADNTGSDRRACARCSRPAVLVTPEGSLCTGHALARSGSDGDWIPLIPKDMARRRMGRGPPALRTAIFARPPQEGDDLADLFDSETYGLIKSLAGNARDSGRGLHSLTRPG